MQVFAMDRVSSIQSNSFSDSDSSSFNAHFKHLMNQIDDHDDTNSKRSSVDGFYSEHSDSYADSEHEWAVIVKEKKIHHQLSEDNIKNTNEEIKFRFPYIDDSSSNDSIKAELQESATNAIAAPEQVSQLIIPTFLQKTNPHNLGIEIRPSQVAPLEIMQETGITNIKATAPRRTLRQMAAPIVAMQKLTNIKRVEPVMTNVQLHLTLLNDLQAKNKISPIMESPTHRSSSISTHHSPRSSKHISPIDLQQDSNSTHSDEDDLEAQDNLNYLNDFEAYMKHNLTNSWTYKDYALVVIPVILSVLMTYGFQLNGMGEAHAETKLWDSSAMFSYATTKIGFEAYFANTNFKDRVDLFTSVLSIYHMVFLPFYVLSRLEGLFAYVKDYHAEKNIKFKINSSINGLYNGAVVSAALATGASVATVLYKNTNFTTNDNETANTLIPYAFAFYTLDAFLRYVIDKNAKLSYLRSYFYDNSQTRAARSDLKKLLDRSLQKIVTLKDDVLNERYNAIYDHKREQSSEFPGVDTFQEFVDLGKITKTRRTSMRRTTIEEIHKKKFNIKTFLKKNWTYILGGFIASIDSYIAYRNIVNMIDRTWQDNSSDNQSALPNFSQGANLALWQANYQYFRKNTHDLPIYDEVLPDWCTQCREATRYTTGNITEGGTYKFHEQNCPGIIGRLFEWKSSEDDWDHTPTQCHSMYNHIEGYFLENADLAADDTVTQEAQQNPFTTKGIFARIIGVLYAAFKFQYILFNVDAAGTRITQTFSKSQTQILPGKRHIIFNSITLLNALIFAGIRATGDAVVAWSVLQNDNLTTSLSWTIIACRGIAASSNYFVDADDTFTRVPGKIHAAYLHTKQILLNGLGYETTEDAFEHVMSDRIIDKINQLKDIVSTMPSEMVIALRRCVN